MDYNNGKNDENKEPNSRVLIVDGLNTFIRAFAANPSVNDDGVHIGGLVGFLKSFRYSISKLKPTRCIVVFDGKDGSKRRRKLFPEYKQKRRVRDRLNRNVSWSDTPLGDEKTSMKMQIGRLIKYLEYLPVTIVYIDRTEADDCIAYICTKLLPDEDKVIMSTDKDFLQLIDNSTLVWNPTKKCIYDEKAVFEEYGLYAKNFITYKILNGDKSDNISGVRGAGLKTIIKNIPLMTEDKLFTIKDLISFTKNASKKNKFLSNIHDSYLLLKRNYILMQLSDVDISNKIKLEIQSSVRRDIPQFLKYKFSVMFMQDKLWSSIPDMDSWSKEFIRLNHFRKTYNGT